MNANQWNWVHKQKSKMCWMGMLREDGRRCIWQETCKRPDKGQHPACSCPAEDEDDCPACDGNGSTSHDSYDPSAPYGHRQVEIACETCKGTGKKPCEVCGHEVEDEQNIGVNEAAAKEAEEESQKAEDAYRDRAFGFDI